MDNEIREFIDKTLASLSDMAKEIELADPLQTMHEKAIRAYTLHCHQVFAELSKSKNISEALEQALKNNWELIKKSLLSYTALPFHPVTAFWCDAAKWVALSKPNSQEPVNPLLFLIPDLQCVVSVHEDYPDLLPVSNQGTGKWEMDLLKIISTHILNDAGTHLIPLRCLLKQDEAVVGLPTIYNPYIDDETDPSVVQLNEKEIYRLFHYSLNTQTIYESKQQFDALAENNDDLLGQLTLLRKKMKENSVHGRGSELAAGQFFDKNLMDFITWYNAIDDHSNEPEEIHQYIQRLRSFSGPVVNPFNKDLIVETLEIVEQLPPEDNEFFQNYFAPLKTLVAMDRPDEQQLEEARQIIYNLLVQLGIIASSTNLSPLQRMLPETLADKVSSLKRYAFKKDNRENPNTCLSILGTKLDQLLVKHHEALAKIKTSTNRQQSLAEEALKILKSAKESFQKKLDNSEPLNGHDKLPLNPQVLDKLQIAYSFQEPEDLDILQSLNPDEITSICNDGRLAASLLDPHVRDQLILFSLTTSTDKLHALLKGLSMSLLPFHKALDRLIPLLRHLSEALDIEQSRAVYETTKDYLVRLCINRPSQFSWDLIAELDQQKNNLLLGSIIDELSKRITTADSFCKVYRVISTHNTEKKTVFFNQMRGKLPSLMNTVNNRTLVYKKLSPEHRMIIFPNGLADQSVPVKTFNEFKSLYSNLHHYEQTDLFQTYKSQLAAWVQSSAQLLQLLRILIPAQFDELLSEIQLDKLEKTSPTEVRSALESKYGGSLYIPRRYLPLLVTLTDFSNIGSFHSLSHAIQLIHQERQRVFERASVHTVDSFSSVTGCDLESLDAEDRQFLLSSEQHINTLFESVEFRLEGFSRIGTYAVANVLQGLSIQQRDSVFDKYIIPHLRDLLKTTTDWKNLLIYLSPQQRKIINRFVLDNLENLKLFSDMNSFNRAPFQYLDEEQCRIIFSTQKKVLLESIKSFKSFAEFLIKTGRPNKENKEIFDLFKYRFCRWQGKSVFTLGTLFSCLGPSELEEAFDLLKGFIPKLIKSAKDLVSIGCFLTKAQLQQISSRIKFEINGHSFEQTIRELSLMKPDEWAATIETIFDFLPQQVQCPDQFSRLSRFLSNSQCRNLFLLCVDNLVTLSEVNESIEFLKSLRFTQACMIYREAGKKCPELLRTGIFGSLIDAFNSDPLSSLSQNDFINIGKYLPISEYQLLFSKTIHKITPGLTTASDYFNLLQSLEFEQASVIYYEIARKLSDNLHLSRTIFCLLLESLSGDPNKFLKICNNPHFPLSYWIRNLDDFIFFMEKNLFLNTELLLKAATPILQTFNPSASEIDRLRQRVSPAECAATIQCFPAPEQEGQPRIDSPGTNSHAFFGSTKRKADNECRDSKRLRREMIDCGHTYTLPDEEEPSLARSIESLFTGWNEACHDWLMEESESESMDFETGFVR
ncbi:hypothetical protein Lqui_2292 [Legionella quinlivanii]|uniref:Uncharacterized protein n=1 Tax=Legionella quinlivanii TaxID=45073 RepID=A0A0W0XTT0_9GAMM|nr:hypothetical protein [Legionella quinlivanii]KTD48028.1 hypothetical protein Lqui_2292 [Legionella quinlivanii]SEG21591.1 hypothetical protein SAMN02746093_02219 [Legionella quinlivanii DSM 21216]STY11141.1 Uncharacterised protein [Legionella quinlivanii]